jgi:hypothetical protein
MQVRRRGRRGQVGGQVRASEGAVLHWSLADMRVACHHTAECRQPEPLTGQGRPAVGACGGRCRRHLWQGVKHVISRRLTNVTKSMIQRLSLHSA